MEIIKRAQRNAFNQRLGNSARDLSVQLGISDLEYHRFDHDKGLGILTHFEARFSNKNECLDEMIDALKSIDRSDLVELFDSKLETTVLFKSSSPAVKARSLGRDPVTGMDFVSIPAGCFAMGSPEAEKERRLDEGPVHQVCVDGFCLGKYEVTNHQYRLFKPDHDSGDYDGNSLNGDDQPVVNVNWNDAVAYAKWLSGKGNGKFRLPTEAEWEYAARAGTTTPYSFGDDPGELGQYAWFNGNSGKKTHPVGQLKPNQFGLYDMYGNVWEWCADWYGDKYYANSLKDNPTGFSTGSQRVSRGGSWHCNSVNVRSAYRGIYGPGVRNGFLGFRLARISP